MKKLKRFADIGASLVLAVSFAFPLIEHMNTAYAFSGGDGTANSPYRIASCSDLENIPVGDGSSGLHYALTQSIDCTTVNSSSGFVPIGNYSTSNGFEGTLDGRNFTVSGVTINASGQDHVGLFSHTNGAIIENLKLSGLTINGADSYAGSLVGDAQDTTLSGDSTTGFTINQSSSGFGIAVAGLAGEFDGTSTTPTISLSSASGSIVSSSSMNDVGGLVGLVSNASVSNSYAALTLNDINVHVVGGLAGNVHNTQFDRNYAAGNINAQLEVGGFASDAYGSSSFTNNFSTTVVANTSTDIAGFIGYVNSDVTASSSSNNYWDINGSGQANCLGQGSLDGCTGVNSDGSDSSHFKNTHTTAPLDQWNFSTNWTQTANYPTLQDQGLGSIQSLTTPGAPTDLTAANADINVVHLSWGVPPDDGGSTITYTVQYKLSSDSSWTDWNQTTDTDDDITGLTFGVSYDFQVTAGNFSGGGGSATASLTTQSEPNTSIDSCQQLQDMQFDPTQSYTMTGDIDCTDFPFTPISNFSGSLDGGSFNITNLDINLPSSSGVGLFSDLEDGSIVHGFNLASSDLAVGSSDVGMLAGNVSGNVQIYDVSSQATVNGDEQVGGLVGFVDASLGDVSFTTVSDSGDISPLGDDDASEVGGIIGQADAQSHSFSLSTASFSGAVNTTTDSDDTGGLIGEMEAFDDATVTIEHGLSNNNQISGGEGTGGIIGEMYADFVDEGTNPPTIQLSDLSHDSGNSIVGTTAVGGIIGDLEGYDGSSITLSQSYNLSEVDSSDGEVGGLVGYIDSDSGGPISININSSYSIGDVNSDDSAVGGLVGEIADPININNSYAQGNVLGTGYVGGLLGNVEGGNYTNDYASGSVSGAGDNIGGLVGDLDNGTVTNSFAAGIVSDSDISSSVGGLIGTANIGVNVSVANSYYDRTNSNQTSCIGVGDIISDTNCSMVDGEGSNPTYFFNNDSAPPLDQWDFLGTWQTTADSYPILQFETEDGGATPINDCEDLQNMSGDGDYYLANNINCSGTINWNGGAGFIPIGFEDEDGFGGTLNGNGHTISDIYINQTGSPFVGLFSVLVDATISNLSLSGQVFGDTGTGGLAGLAVGSQVNNVSDKVTVTGQATDADEEEELVGVGGLVGMMFEDSTISQSYSSGSVIDASVDDDTFIAGGGLVGEMFDGLVTDSYSTASVTDSGSAGELMNGGLVGIMFDGGVDPPIVSNTYSTGPVSVGDNELAGGLIGGTEGGELDNSFSVGFVSAGDNGGAGGLIGEDDADEFSNNFFDATLTGTSDCDANGDDITDCTAVNTGDSPDPDYFFNNTSNDPFSGQWDFDDIWSSHTDTYPTLQNTPVVEPIVQITDCSELQDMNNDLSANYELMNDIDCSDTVNWNGGAGFIPVGAPGDGGFSGSLDGHGYAISGLYINGGADAGLFDTLSGGATVKDFYLSGDISGGEVVGAVAGITQDNSTIKNVNSNASVTGLAIDSDDGGLVGEMSDNSSISQSSSSGLIAVDGLSDPWMGGLVGEMDDASSIDNSYSRATINMTNNAGEAGGLAGDMSSTTSIDKSYAITTIHATGAVGGLVGAMGEDSSLTNSFGGMSFSLEDLTAVGNLIGDYESDTALSNDYYDDGPVLASFGSPVGCTGTGIGFPADPDGCTQVNTDGNDPGYFFDSSSVAPLSSWDFDSTWSYRLDDYPVLRSPGEAQMTVDSTPGVHELDVSWTAPDGAFLPTGFDLEYKLDTASDWTIVNVGSADDRSEVISNLLANTQYDVRIRYTNQFETSDWIGFTQSTTANNSGGGSKSGSGGLTVGKLSVDSGNSGGSSTPAASSNNILLDDFNDYLDGAGHQLIGLVVGQVIHFNVDNNGTTEHHTATVKSINGNIVTFTIASKPFDVPVAIGQTKTVSLDGMKILKITVNSITYGVVNATFSQIHPAATASTSKATVKTGSKAAAPAKNHGELYGLIAIGILACLLVMLLGRRRNGKSSR